MAPWTKASVDVEGPGGVGAGAGCTGTVGVVVGAEVVALLSVTGTATDLWALGTLANTLVVVLPFLSYMSSCSCSTTD